jgi:hypothetical protein
MSTDQESFASRLVGSTGVFAVFFAACALLGQHHLPSTPSLSLFLLAAYALTAIVVDSKIAWPFSELAGKIPIFGPGLYSEDKDGTQSGLLSCAMCTGMWTGAALAAAGISIYPIGDGLLGARDLVVHGIISSGASFAGHLVVEKLKK